MSPDIIFADDIRNALLAANEGGTPSLEQIRTILYQNQSGDTVPAAYKAGYTAALTTVALAFGIAPQAITSQPLNKTDPYKIKSPPEWIRTHAKKEINDEQD